MVTRHLGNPIQPSNHHILIVSLVAITRAARHRAHLGGMADEEESKAAPQRRTAGSGRLLTFAYEYAHHPDWHRLKTCDACEATIRSAFKRIGFDTSPNYPVGPSGMKKTVKDAASVLKSGDVLSAYVFCHGFAREHNQYLATEGGIVNARSLCNIVSQTVLDMDVSGVTFLLLLDCCRKAVGECDLSYWTSALQDDGDHHVSDEDYAKLDAKSLTIAVSYSTHSGAY